jgi:hypothetical protein
MKRLVYIISTFLFVAGMYGGNVGAGCDELVCGKWRNSKGKYNWTTIIDRSSDGVWDFQTRIIDPKKITKFGFKAGMITGRFNKVDEGRYFGETMWRDHFRRLHGWLNSLKSMNKQD